MWCENCKQEVPGIASPRAEDDIQCARCGEELNVDVQPTAEDPTTVTPESSYTIRPPAPRHEEPLLPELDIWEVDDWRIDDHLADARLLVAWARQSAEPAQPSHNHELAPAPVAMEPRLHRSDPSHARQVTESPQPQKRRRPSFMAWLLLSLGMMALACGGVLLGLSIAQQRPELWTIGLPMVFAGQAGLLLGLVFQLVSIWRYHRLLAKIEAFEAHYQPAAPMGASYSEGGRSFYTHMAEGANPQMLLSDLKNQMDLLSLSLKQRR